MSCFPAGSRGVRVQRCLVEVHARATCTLMELCVHAPMGPWVVGGKCGPFGRAMTDSSRPLARNASLLAVQSSSLCVLLRHLADRAVQAGLFKLVPRGCCIVPTTARREDVYHSVHGFFDWTWTVDVYNICHKAQFTGLGIASLFPALHVHFLRHALFLRVAGRLSRSGYNAGHLSCRGYNTGPARSATGS